MISPCIFIDIDSNKSLVCTKPVPGQFEPKRAAENISLLHAHAMKKNINVISLVETKLLAKPNYDKLDATLEKKHLLVKPGEKKDKVKELLLQNKQIVLGKDNFDIFSNTLLLDLLKEAKVQNLVVYGYGIDYGIEHAGVKLREEGFNIYIPVDAVTAINEVNREPAVKELHNVGVQIWNSEFLMQNT
ncbi:MAG TPA: isochorismatase family protein [Candidatus Gracilibacteria bacterium]|nr:isochorismatase family protein [Candidatus Gracilibacteria bacterium]